MQHASQQDTGAFWVPAIERAAARSLRELQQARFTGLVERLTNVQFYRSIFVKACSSPTLDGLSRLPFTTKDDLREGYPFGFLTCPTSELVEMHGSSGTTGKPVIVGYSHADIQTWKSLMARTLTAAGITSNDVLQNAYGYGLFTGGLGFHYGAMEIGAGIIPTSAGRTDLQILAAEDLGATVLCCTPSFALYLAGEAASLGRPLSGTGLRIGMFGAEPWSEEMRARIEAAIGLTAYDVYGLSEMIGPGVAFECRLRNGLHVNEDVFFPEIVDPETGRSLPDGEVGELVLTSIGRDAMPLLRYRTRDLTRFLPGACECGRTLRRIERIIGRSDDMLIVAGVNFHPSQVESLILRIAGTTGHYQIWLWTDDVRDRIEVRIESEPGLLPSDREPVVHSVAACLRDNIGIRMDVKIVDPGSLDKSVMGKAKRVFDNRSKK
ncbi:MAG TPA: phenylacetate--CoA ligase [Blastocatellia bacterium]